MIIINIKKVSKKIILNTIKNKIQYSKPSFLDGCITAKIDIFLNPKTRPAAIILLEKMCCDDKEICEEMLSMLFYEKIVEYASKRRINIPVTRIIDYEEIDNGDLIPIGKSITCRIRIKDRFMFGLD